MNTQTIDTPNGAVAVHESAGSGPALVLLHGNSASSRAFSRQLDGPLGARFRLVAIDLPGHGDSDDAKDPSLYTLRGHAAAARAAVDALGLADARFVGWSLGGHVALEMAPDLPKAKGFVIFGTPPLGVPPAMAEAFLPNPAMNLTFAPSFERAQGAAFVASFFAPDFFDVPPSFLEDALRADGRARAGLPASFAPNASHDEVAVVRALTVPLAILHGEHEQLVNGAYLASLAAPTLWRGAVQIVPGAGHAPQWETPDAFDALVTAFVEETQ
jgi:pimeloyl-ACP methyl ester carboxylesterase